MVLLKLRPEISSVNGELKKRISDRDNSRYSSLPHPHIRWDMSQDPQSMTEATDSPKPYDYAVFLPIRVLTVKFGNLPCALNVGSAVLTTR